MKTKVILFFLIFVQSLLYSKSDNRVIHAYISTYRRGIKIVKEFEKDTGIKVLYNDKKISTNEAVVKLLSNKTSPVVSIWIGGVGIGHIDAKNQGLTIPYASPETKKVRKIYKDSKSFWTGLYIGPLVIGVNKKLLKEQGLPEPSGWKDLLKPIYKGKIEVANPNSSGTAYNFITTILDINNGNEEKSFDYLKKVNINIKRYTKSGSKPGRNCAKGKIPIAIGYSHDMLSIISEGHPLNIVLPKEGTGYEISSISLIKDGPDTETAKILFDWILSKKGQKILADTFTIPVSLNAPLKNIGVIKGKKYLDIEKLKTVNQDVIWDVNNKTRLIKKWNKEIGSKNKNKIEKYDIYEIK